MTTLPALNPTDPLTVPTLTVPQTEVESITNQMQQLRLANEQLQQANTALTAQLSQVAQPTVPQTSAFPSVPLVVAPTVAAQPTTVAASAVDAPSNSTVRVRPHAPKPFTGSTSSENVELWLIQMKLYLMVAKIPPNDYVLHSLTYLQDVALYWAHDNIINKPNKTFTWDEFYKLITERFNPVETNKVARAKLSGLKQTGSASDYGVEFVRVVQQITDMTEADKIYRFIDGLKPKTMEDVDRAQPETLEKAMSLAVQADLRFKHQQQKKQTQQTKPSTNRTLFSPSFNPKPTSFRPFNNNYRNPNQMDLSNMENVSEQGNENKNQNDPSLSAIQSIKGPGLSKLMDEERAYLRSIGGCFRCRKRGHMWSSCPLNQAPSNPSQSKNP
jgi:hypothetical protein